MFRGKTIEFPLSLSAELLVEGFRVLNYKRDIYAGFPRLTEEGDKAGRVALSLRPVAGSEETVTLTEL